MSARGAPNSGWALSSGGLVALAIADRPEEQQGCRTKTRQRPSRRLWNSHGFRIEANELKINRQVAGGWGSVSENEQVFTGVSGTHQSRRNGGTIDCQRKTVRGGKGIEAEGMEGCGIGECAAAPVCHHHPTRRPDVQIDLLGRIVNTHHEPERVAHLSDFEPHREGVVEDLVETIGQLMIVGHRIARGRDGIQTQEPPRHAEGR